MKKIIQLGAFCAAMFAAAGLGVSPASAAPSEAAIVVEGSASADATQQTRAGNMVPVGGGMWTYGIWDKKVHSLYAHERSTHRASVKSSGKVTRSAWQPPKTLAYATRGKAFSGNQSYWATRG